MLTHRSGRMILVVDDEPDITTLLCRWLEGEGYRCSTASNGVEALEFLGKHKVDLVISDILMPIMSGMDLLNAMRTSYPDIAVLMVTAVDDRETGCLASELGAFGYVIKPFRKNEIVIHVANALELRDMKRLTKEYSRNLEEHIQTARREIFRREEIVLRMIAYSGALHGETADHIQRIGLYASELAIRVRLDRTLQEVDDIRLAAALHDVGKIAVPEHILCKPGSLNPEESAVMKTHCALGAQILGAADTGALKMGREIAMCHHENWDGTGYPDGLIGKEIPELARIVAVVDVYDSLVHDRVYRPAFSEETAVGIIVEGKGTKFEPEIVNCFLDALPDLRKIRHKLDTGSAGEFFPQRLEQ